MGIAYIIVSIVPISLLVYVWYLDRLEHEPWSLIAKVFLFSALLGTAAAALLEEVGGAILQSTFIGQVPYIGDFLYFFFVVAFVEEFCKRLPVTRIVWNNPAFDHRFDAIVYCVASAIGFAVAENIMYVGMFGAEVTIGRLIPVHTICGVFMGYYLGCAKICERGRNMAACSKYRTLSLLIPMIIHGTWDFCVSVDVPLLEWFVLIGIVVLTIYAFIRLKTYAKFDAPL
ncbi:MAG: PrsW family glutamic-type intramembrane protease [Coriobacteriia bacterium]|nr:PrsW family glutamic-type intramembrane protease [Coriobacteriia bacterium]